MPYSSKCHSSNERVSAEFTAEEIKASLDSIGDLIAPGNDGMPLVFYKNYWDTVGDMVIHEVLDVLRGGSIPEGWNETVVDSSQRFRTPISEKTYALLASATLSISS